MAQTIYDFRDIPQEKTVFPLMTMGRIPSSCAGSTITYIQHTTELTPSGYLSNDWLIMPIPYISWVIDPNASSLVSLLIYVSGNALSTGFYLWRSFPLYNIQNYMNDLKVPGFYARFAIANDNVGAIGPDGYIIARGGI